MDSRALHRGSANVGSTRRVLLYVSFQVPNNPAPGSTYSLLEEYRGRFRLRRFERWRDPVAEADAEGEEEGEAKAKAKAEGEGEDEDARGGAARSDGASFVAAPTDGELGGGPFIDERRVRRLP
jgi:hypothetical protein